MKIAYQGEHSGVSVAVDGSTYTFPRDVPVDVPASVGRKLAEENPTTWSVEEAEKPKKAKADADAPDTKEN